VCVCVCVCVRERERERERERMSESVYKFQLPFSAWAHEATKVRSDPSISHGFLIRQPLKEARVRFALQSLKFKSSKILVLCYNF
jgi:hypothetical protein